MANVVYGFKAYDLELNEPIDPASISIDGGGLVLRWCAEDRSFFNARTDNIVIRYSTRRNDSDGQEIFEGDWVQQGAFKGQVKWDEDKCGFVVEYPDWNARAMVIDSRIDALWPHKIKVVTAPSTDGKGEG